MNLNTFVYNDIYGSQFAKQKYGNDRKYQYYNHILGLHNKYFEKGQIHHTIFQPNTQNTQKTRSQLANRYKQRVNEMNKTKMKSLEIGNHKRIQQFEIQQVNDRTFRIRKKNKIVNDLRLSHQNTYRTKQLDEIHQKDNILVQAQKLRKIISTASNSRNVSNSVKQKMKKQYALLSL